MLHEYIAAGTSKGDFCSRLKAVLGDYTSNPIASESQRARNPSNVASAFAGMGTAPSMSADFRTESEVARERAGANLRREERDRILEQVQQDADGRNRK